MHFFRNLFVNAVLNPSLRAAFPRSYVQDVLYVGFAGAKNRPQKNYYF